MPCNLRILDKTQADVKIAVIIDNTGGFKIVRLYENSADLIREIGGSCRRTDYSPPLPLSSDYASGNLELATDKAGRDWQKVCEEPERLN